MSNIHTLKPFKSGDDPRRNTTGRPKGAKNHSTLDRLIIKHLNKKVKVNGVEMIMLDVIAERLIDDAAHGKYRALKLLLDRTEGKVKTAAQMEIQNGGTRASNQMTDEDYERLKKIFPNDQPVKL